MPRLPRNSFQTSFFHVMSQGINKNFIFDAPEDIKKYIDFMYEFKDEYNVSIIVYCIMNNHVHLLLQVNTVENLSSYMHRLNTKYANYYNKKYNRVGFVFRNRFRSEGIYTEQYLYNCVNYIFNNPVRAGICKDIKEYPYSNYKEYALVNDISNIECNEYINFIDIVEDKAKSCKSIVKEFLKEKNRDIVQISHNLEALKELIIILNKNNIPLSTMERELGINRKKIKKILLDDNIVIMKTCYL